MGAHPYCYFVEYQCDVQAALDALREHEFRSGRYNPVQPFPSFPVEDRSDGPVPAYSSIEEARKAAGAEGTRSILDVDRVSEVPGFGSAVPLDGETLIEVFGTAQPTREVVEGDLSFLEEIGRGECIYFCVFEHEEPTHLVFAGVSYD